MQQTISENFLDLVPPISEDGSGYYEKLLLLRACLRSLLSLLKKAGHTDSNLLNTLIVSWIPYFLIPRNNSGSTVKVKISNKKNNSQVTKAFNSWVGTSEAIRLLSKKNTLKKFFSILISSSHTLIGAIKMCKNYSFLYCKAAASFRNASPLLYHTLICNINSCLAKAGEGAQKELLRSQYKNRYWFLGLTRAYKDRLSSTKCTRILSTRSATTIANCGSVSLKEWLAGLIDGDGSFILSKKGYASLEITMDIRDEHALQIIKNIYGGSIKLRSGANALRYRLHHKSGLLKIIQDTNGLIRNSNRMVQLNKICNKYEIKFIYPKNLVSDNGWMSGFFDADGTITINSNNWQLSLSISQKTSNLLEPLTDLYGGNIYIDRASVQSFKWYVTKRESILTLIEYFKKHPSRSAKQNRLHLIPRFYELKDLKAHKELDLNSGLAKSWKYFMCKWLKYEKKDI